MVKRPQVISIEGVTPEAAREYTSLCNKVETLTCAARNAAKSDVRSARALVYEAHGVYKDMQQKRLTIGDGIEDLATDVVSWAFHQSEENTPYLLAVARTMVGNEPPTRAGYMLIYSALNRCHTIQDPSYRTDAFAEVLTMLQYAPNGKVKETLLPHVPNLAADKVVIDNLRRRPSTGAILRRSKTVRAQIALASGMWDAIRAIGIKTMR